MYYITLFNCVFQSVKKSLLLHYYSENYEIMVSLQNKQLLCTFKLVKI